ncbi:MAG TPA: universal stress protein [Xanthobacteraceae bacterium]|nr:universal stress protein [Xanthobacteraceae bacterium]
MTFSTIMVYVDVEAFDNSSLGVAVDLAEKFDAKLIGISAASLAWTYYAEGLPRELLEQLNADVAKRLADTEQRFRCAVTKRVRRLEWRSAITAPESYVPHQSRAADLVVVGRNRDGLIRSPLDVGDLVMRAGRPILVVPPTVDKVALKSAVVAWKDTREARRAVNDALPLLKKMKDVIVVEMIDDESDRGAAHARLTDVIAWFGTHGISALSRVFRFAESRDPMERLWEYGADFIVAGAYGHTQTREWVFGGFTRDLLRRCPHCALLSH